MSTKVDSGYFSASYSDARLRILQALWALQKQGLKSELFELEIKSQLEQKLVADAFYFPSEKKKQKLLIVSSGIHGAEATLGSALQLYFLRQIMPRLNRAGLGVLIFHSLNPYGFVTGRRVTENNIDLNRNFLKDKSDFKKIKNEAYKKLQIILSQQKSVESHFWESLRVYFKMLRLAIKGREARQKLRQAFAGGQFSDPEGIFYGGQDYEAQVPWVQNILEKTLPEYEEVLLYDIHTGLGKASALQMISSLQSDMKAPHFQKLMRGMKSEKEIFFVTPDTDGFYETHGDFVDFVYTQAAKTAKVTALTAEFGTLGENLRSQLSTSVRLILENQGWHWGFASRATEWKVKKSFTDLFNPQNKAWKEKVLYLGAKALELSFSDELTPKSESEKNNAVG